MSELHHIPEVSQDFLLGIPEKSNNLGVFGSENDLATCPDCGNIFSCRNIEKYRKSKNETEYFPGLCKFKLNKIICNECLSKRNGTFIEPEKPKNVIKKRCSYCKEHKPIYDFYKSGRQKGDGYRSECISCISIKNRRKREKRKQNSK